MLMNADAPIQFFVTPDKVLILNAYRDVTDVRMAKAHPPEEDLWPTVWGDSIGHWEGDTLVVDTIAVKNPHEYFHGAPPLSEKAHYVQRIRMDKPGHLVDDITIEDTMQVEVEYANKVTMNYTLQAYSPWEGLEIKFRGTKGDLTHRHVEVHGVFGGKRQKAEGGQSPDEAARRHPLLPNAESPDRQHDGPAWPSC